MRDYFLAVLIGVVFALAGGGCRPVDAESAVACVAACGAAGIKSVKPTECLCNDPASRICPTPTEVTRPADGGS